MTNEIGWEKILATALVTSFFTSCLTEPVKAAVQKSIKLKDLRSWIYREIVNNFIALQGQIDMARQSDTMEDGVGYRFGLSYKRSAYDKGQKDAAEFYDLGYKEFCWIEDHYRQCEIVINSNPSDCLRIASFAAKSILHGIKDRKISKSLLFKVSPPWCRDLFRNELPKIDYHHTNPPNVTERLLRSLDRIQYWYWRYFCHSSSAK